ncbi:MAG TPA: Na+/H+ antiporter [Candidatus Baltobacteraceae bacterium]|nr:Na+/H+ antiporter [Candidatus Baltobacteraceae bacterium]
MNEPVLLVGGLAVALALAIVSKRLDVPYPILFVLGGTVLAFVPGIPPVHIAPDWIFLAILPPLLFSAGWSTDWIIFRENLPAIVQLAIGLVIATTVVVALIANAIVPALGLAGAFVLGAIVSPPDAVAAAASFERFAVPRRIRGVIEGEALVNDATALVIYGYAVAASAVAFSLRTAAWSFLLVAVGGIVVGLVVSWVIEGLSRVLSRYDLSDTLVENLLLIGTPYLAYLSGQALHFSAVLAVVVAGIALSRRSSVVYGPQTRLIAYNVWTLWIYLLNAYVFLAIGLQLRSFVAQGSRIFDALPAALILSAAVIVIRLLWIFPTTWLARYVRSLRGCYSHVPFSWLTVIGWSGMRGIVSLAAALALPANFPHRQFIVFITFVVIFITLVGQGLTLNPLLRALHVEEESDEGRHEIEIRTAALQAGLSRIGELQTRSDDPHEREDLAQLRHEYESRIAHLRSVDADGHHPVLADVTHDYAEKEALRAERLAIMRLRDAGEIPDEIFRRIQYDLDLAESRLS